VGHKMQIVIGNRARGLGQIKNIYKRNTERPAVDDGLATLIGPQREVGVALATNV